MSKLYRAIISLEIEAEDQQAAIREVMDIVTDDSMIIESISEKTLHNFAVGNQVHVRGVSNPNLYVISQLLPGMGCMIRQAGTAPNGKPYAEQRFDVSMLVTGEGFRAQRHALAILASCLGEGATHAALLHSSGCTAQALEALVDQGLARKRTAPMANPPDFVVTRYWITDEGLQTVKGASK